MAKTAFLAKVAATIERHGLLGRGDLVVVAVSGGPDSMALLHALIELRGQFALRLSVAHLNHLLRGRASDDDAEFVAARAAAAGLPCRTGATDVAAERRQHGGSLEMAARRARYEFLEAVALEDAAQRVALGHTADDQVETILLRLLRGGELAALRGMPVARPLSPTSRATLIRPLLDVTRAEVLDYLASRGIPWRSDATNADRSFLRNWVRHELLPLLEARGGKVRAALLGAVERARTLSGLVGAQASDLVAVGEGGARLDPARLAAAPRVVRREALRRAYCAAGGRGDLTRRALAAAECLIAPPAGRSASLAGGFVAERCYDALVVRQRRPKAPNISLTLAVPGRIEVPELGLWLEASPLDCPPPWQKGRWEEVVDLDAVGERLEVRTRRAGDRFVPLGGAASTKLKDFLIAQRVPRADRGRLLLVIGRAGVAWVVGLRLDHRARVTPATSRVARLRAGPL
ncbi:MAG TPA: tRNA lysidine(34) synthetase TilS [Planctomycetota bacterium]|nr:tRNA lysidine(34) synthetase TilS [Planctomycetota bacterium]